MIKALMPMKGNSERVPNKNLRLFAGKPLYHRVLETLLAVDKISEVAIDTDSGNIMEDLRKNFPMVTIIERPVELHGDFVSMNDIIAHDMKVLGGEHFIQTHSTNPLLTAVTLNKAIDSYFDNLSKHDSIFSVTPMQTRFYDINGKAVNHNPAELIRTQDLPPLMEENSNFFIFSSSSFAASGNKRIGNTPMLWPMNKLEAVDIDYEEDFQIAELLYTIKNKNVGV